MEKIIKIVESLLPQLHGWCTLEKATKLIELIDKNKFETCVEIGVFGGASLIPQALALFNNKKGKVYGIDPWTKDCALEEMISEDHKKWWGDLDMEAIYEGCKKRIQDLNLQDYCELIRDKSENVHDKFQNESIDLLHIDGNHSESLSYKDATLYLPKVKINGYILFDDIWWTEKDNYVTTRKALIYLFEKCDKVDVINNDCLLLKKIKP